MKIDNALAGLAVADLSAAEAWYSKLVGRAPDSKPMAGLFEYDFAAGGMLQIFEDKQRAGRSSATLVIDDLDAALAKLDTDGIAHGSASRASYVETVILNDPDGNQIVLAEPKGGASEGAS